LSCDQFADVVRIIRENGIDVLVCDYRMPPVTGFDLLQQVQTAGLRIPSVMISASASSIDARRARELGVERGRKSVQIFTPDKLELHHAIMRSGDRELALDLVSNRVRRGGRHQILRSVQRGREFAKRVCRMAMRSWTAAFIRPDLKQLHETRNRQTIRPARPNVLAA
jgi:CheY-like chemotaxis protein